MPYDPHKHHRRSIRLQGYDYSLAGAYYFSVVAQDRACLFGSVVNAEMMLNDAGEMLWQQWHALSQRFVNVELDEFIVMPNHVHGILVVTDQISRRGDGLSSPSTESPAPDGRGAPLSSPDVARASDGGQSQASGQAQGSTRAQASGQAQGAAPTGLSGADNVADSPTLGNVLGAWKSIVTNDYIKGVRQSNWEPFEGKLWQRNYWEHIIRNERELDAIREYIINNPANWDNDDNNPKIDGR